MKLKTQIVIIFVQLVLGMNFVHGTTETWSDSIKIKYLFNPIVKTATKVAGTQRDIAASITSIDINMIEQTPSNSILEVVRDHVPGLYMTERNLMGYGVAENSAGKISIRGLGGGLATHVLILRNGRPDFMGLMGCTIADEFALDGIEKIEVLRGPASFLYGTNAIGGVINIVSKKMTEKGFKTHINGSYGSFHSQKLSVNHGGNLGNFEYYFTGSTRKTDGHRKFSDYEADHYTAHIGYSIGKKTQIEMNGSLANIDLFDPGPESDPFTDHWYDLQRYGGDVTVILQSRFGESYLKIHGNFGRHKIWDGWHSHDQTLGAMVYHNVKPWAENTSTIGFDIKKYGGHEENTHAGKDFKITEYAPYIHTQQLIFRRMIVSAGLRLEHHELYGYEILPKAGLVTHPTNTTSIRLSTSKGFRSPSIRELYFWIMSNPDLNPEKLWNYEIGLTQHFGKRLKFEATLFRNEADNMIRCSNPGFPFKWINSGKFTHTGYELMLYWLPMDRLECGASWSKLDLGNETLNAPGKKLTAYLTFQIWRVTLSGNAIHVRDLYGDDFRQKPMDNYTVVNLAARASLFGPIALKTSVKNILNTRYQSMYGYPMPGRTFAVDLGYSY